MTGDHGHVPVMRERMAELLAPAVTALGDRAILIDGTLGAGGHTEYFLSTFPQLRVIGVDRDGAELARAIQRLSPFKDRLMTVNARFDEIADELRTSSNPIASDLRHYGLAGGFFDLGVSSMQLDQTDRGFTYREDGPLDMRMDASRGKTAADILNTYSHGELAHVLKAYGDEKFASKIAAAIIREREKEPWTSAGRLVELLYATIPAAARRTGGHPAKRTFQALRVEVNGELEAIENVIPLIAKMLAPHGRAVFMSYQSLEDKIVKRAFQELTTSKAPAGLPMDIPAYAPKFQLVTRGAEMASEEEIERNPRAKSVRVRALERRPEPPGT